MKAEGRICRCEGRGERGAGSWRKLQLPTPSSFVSFFERGDERRLWKHQDRKAWNGKALETIVKKREAHANFARCRAAERDRESLRSPTLSRKARRRFDTALLIFLAAGRRSSHVLTTATRARGRATAK